MSQLIAERYLPEWIRDAEARLRDLRKAAAPRVRRRDRRAQAGFPRSRGGYSPQCRPWQRRHPRPPLVGGHSGRPYRRGDSPGLVAAGPPPLARTRRRCPRPGRDPPRAAPAPVPLHQPIPYPDLGPVPRHAPPTLRHTAPTLGQRRQPSDDRRRSPALARPGHNARPPHHPCRGQRPTPPTHHGRLAPMDHPGSANVLSRRTHCWLSAPATAHPARQRRQAVGTHGTTGVLAAKRPKPPAAVETSTRHIKTRHLMQTTSDIRAEDFGN